MANNNKRGKYSTWTKNFGQSVRFGAKEVLSDIAPSIAETASSLPEEMRELKQDLRKLRGNKRQIVNYLLGEEEQFSKYAGLLAKNAKQSWKTGKWIDKNREEKMTMAAMGMDDMDFDFDDSGSMDFDTPDASFEDLDMGPSKIVNISGPSTKAIGVVNESIQGTTSAITSGFSSLERSNKNNFAMTEALQRHFHTETMTKVDAINNNLAAMVQFNNDSMSTFVQASMEFYDKNLAVLNSINEAMLRISPPPKAKKERTQYESPVDMFMSGGFSIKGYSRLIAKNTKKAFDDSLIGSMIPLLNNEMILADMASNPLGSLMKLGMESILPDRFKKSLGNMDKGFKNFIPALLTKFGSYNGNNEMLKLLGSIFGIKTEVKAKRYKQGEYEHGPIPFDGETKVAITRVIPGYLSRQTAILEVIAKSLNKRISDDDLEGSIRERGIVFNYSKDGTSAGSFMRRNEAIKYQRREERDLITREYSDSRYALIDALRNHEGSKNIDRSIDVEDYLVGLTHSNATLRPKDLNQIKRMLWIGSHNGKKPPMGDDKYLNEIPDSTAEAIMYALSSLEKEDPKDKTTNKHILMGLYGNERHAARAKLNNYNSSYASDDEYGSGRHEFMSTIHKGSIFDMYTDRSDKTVVPKYDIKVNEFGEYYMPQNKLDDFNKFYKVHFKTAKQCYEYYQKKTNKKEGEVVSDTATEDTSFKSFTGKIQELIQAPLNKMADLFDAVNNKMYEVIFGKDGLGGNIEELLLGKKDEKTKRYSGGWFSEAINGVKDTYASTKKYLFGGTDENGDPKPGILTNMTEKFTKVMNDYFFGEDEKIIGPDGKETIKKHKSIFETIQTTLVDGFGDLASVLFGNGNGGEEGQRKRSLEQAKEAFNKAIPDIGKGAGLGAIVGTVSGLGGFGLLGSLFLPGGPIGGALVGGAVGLLSQSKGFREMLFGKEETDEQGNVTRVGGLISSKMVDWFKKKKTALLGGSAMGVISTATGHGIAFGLMPSIAVGAFGPVIAGAAWGLISHSERFRNMIFGREVKDDNGKVIKRVGGLINGNMMGNFKRMLPRGIAGAISGMAGMGVISQLGLVGSMVATGPIPAAILGAGFGIATASKDFTQRMFGYQDEKGNYHSGALDRMKNFFTVEIFEPLKLRIHEELFAASVYIRKNVLRPIRRAIFPIKELVLDIGKTIKNTMSDMFEPIKEGFHNIFVVMTDAMKSIFRPMIKVVSTLSSWLFKRFKTAMKISIQTALLPLRMVGGLARMIIQGKDYKSGVTTALGGVKDALKNGSGLVGAIGGLGKAVFNPETRLSEANAEDERLRKEDEQYELEGNAVLQAERKKMLAMREKIRAGGYNLTDEQIAEKLKASQQKANAEAKIVDTAAKSGDPMQQMTAKMIEQGAERGMKLDILHNDLVELKTGQKVANEAAGVKADDDASLVDEKKRLEKKEEAIEEREEKNAENLDEISKGIKGLSGDGGKKDKKGWFWSLLGGIGSIASGIFGFLGSIGTVAGAALGIYGILKTIFGDKKKGGKSEQLVHSEQAGRFSEYGAKKISQFLAKHPNATLAVAKAPFELGKAGYNGIKNIGSKIKSLGGKLGDKLTNRIYTKDEFYTHFKDYIKDAKHLDASYNDYLKNPDKFYKRTRIGKAVDFVKAGGIQSKIKSLGGKLFNATDFGKGWNLRNEYVDGAGSTMGRLGQGFSRLYRNTQKYGLRRAMLNPGRTSVYVRQGGKILPAAEPKLVKAVRRGIGSAITTKEDFVEGVSGLINKAGVIPSKIKSIGGKIFNATDFGKGWNYRGGIGKAGVGSFTGQLGQGFGRMYRNAKKYGWETATRNAGFLGTSVKKSVFDKEGVGRLVKTDEPWLVKKVRRGIGSVIGAKEAVGSTVKSLEEKAGSLFGKKIGTGNQTEKIGNGIISKISSALDSFISGDACKNLFGKATEKIAKFKKTILNLAEKFADSKIITVLQKLFPKKFAEATSKTAVAATGVGLIVTAAFTVYDGITGALEADRLFDVAKEDVTMKMRLVSAFINAFFGLPPMMWIDLILTAMSFGALAASDTLFGKALKAVGVDIKNFDHRKIFARYIYELASEEDEVNKLNDAQKKYDKAFEAYKKKNNKGDDYTKEQWREDTGNKTTWQKYGAPIIDKVLGIGKEADIKVKSFGERISGWLDDMTIWFKNAVKSITSFSPIGWFKELIGLGKDWSLSKQFNDIGDRLTNWLPENKTGLHPIDTTKKFASNAWDTAKKTASTVKNFFFGSANGFSQGDSRWKNKAFGSSTFGLEACGPLALANITGKDPRALAAIAHANDFSGAGIKPSYFRRAAGQLGLGYRENNTSQDMYTGLLSGRPMIVGGSSTNPNSPFYGNGHYVVANGLNSKGQANIYNPSGHGKSMSVDPKTLIRESLGHGGYSGSFSGAGRMSISEAMRNDSIITPEDVKRYEEEQAQKREEYNQYLMDNDLSTKDLSFDDYIKKVNKEEGIRGITNAEREKLLALNALKNRSTHSDANIVRDTFVDEETAAMADKKDGITAKTDGTTETITHADGSVTTRNTKTGKTFRTTGSSVTGSKSDEGLGIMDILTGFGLGLTNLFSSVWGGGKYKNVTLSDIKNGISAKISSLFGKNKGSGHRGNGVPDDIGKLEVEPPDGKYWVRQNGNVKLKGCHSQVVDVLETLGKWFFEKTGHKLVVTAGTNGRHAEGKYSHAQGWKVDVNDWYGPENLQGGYITDGNSLTQPFKEFGHSCGLGMADEGDHIDVQFADGYDWQDGKTYGGWSTKGGGGGSFDASEGHIDTKKAVWNYLVNDLEMNREGAAGVMGNIEQESRFDTNAYNPDDVDGNPSGGLVQWHAGRFNNLKNYAASIGKDWSDVESQMGYLGQELNGPYEHVYEKMKNAPSFGDAVDTWVRKFEVPADIPGEIAKRTPMAEAYYNDHSNFEGGANGFFAQTAPTLIPQLFGMNSVPSYNSPITINPMGTPYYGGQGSSGNQLGMVLANGLFAWKQRYDERGRAKKLGALMNQYARTHTPPDVVQATVRNATADRILPAKVDTGGASMDDLLLSIRALDSHAELNQIIAYLAAIAANGGTGKGSVELDRKTEIDLQRNIEMAKRDVREANSHRRLNQQAMGNLENVLGNVEGFPANALALAQEISRGGKFRTS